MKHQKVTDVKNAKNSYKLTPTGEILCKSFKFIFLSPFYYYLSFYALMPMLLRLPDWSWWSSLIGFIMMSLMIYLVQGTFLMHSFLSLDQFKKLVNQLRKDKSVVSDGGQGLLSIDLWSWEKNRGRYQRVKWPGREWLGRDHYSVPQ